MQAVFHVQCCNVHTSATEVIADCSGLNLQTIPGSNQIPEATTKLLLNNNNISGTINTKIFKHLSHLTYLDLSNNFIRRMVAFQGLDFLEYLDIKNNYLCLDTMSFPSKSLRGLVSLRVFKLERPRGGQCPSMGTLNGELFSHMKHLEELRINGLQTTFGPGFQTLSKLRILRVTGSNYAFNGSVTDDTFKVFKNGNISEISLQNTNIETLSPTAFSYFPYLQTLVITCSQHLGLSRALATVQHLNTKVLHTLVLDGLGGRHVSSPLSKVTYTNFCSQSTLSIKRLTLRQNRIIILDISIFNSTCLPLLEYIAVGYNSIISLLNIHPRPLMNITKVRTFDSSYFGVLPSLLNNKQNCMHIKETEDYFLKEPNLPKLLPKDIIRPKWKSSFSIPPSVKFIHAQHSANTIDCKKYGRTRVYSSSNNVRFLNMSYTRIPHGSCSPKFYSTLQYLDISNVGMKLISNKFFKYAPNLMYLNIKSNLLGMFNSSIRFTKYTPKLRSLDISNNGYKNIHFDDIKMLGNLESLILANNELDHLTLHINYMKSLNYLDISGNKLTSLDDNTQDELDNIARQQNITINLADNPFICDCNTRIFVEWIQVTTTQLLDKEKYQCKYNNTIVAILTVDLVKLETICSTKPLHKSIKTQNSAIIY